MIIQCIECKQKTTLNDEKITEIPFLLCCPRCGAYMQVDLQVTPLKVFKLDKGKGGTAVTIDRSSPTYNLQKDPIYVKSKVGSLERIILDKIINGKTKLPQPDSVLPEIRLLMRDENTTSQDMEEILRRSEDVSRSVVKLANSEARMEGSEKIRNLTKAIERLGFETVEKAAIAVEVRKCYLKAKNPDLLEIMKGNWTNALCCAIAANDIALAVNYTNPDVAFLVGLLKGLGDIVIGHTIDNISPEEYEKYKLNEDRIIELFVNLSSTFSAKIVREWGMSEQVVKAVESHFADDEIEDRLVDISNLAHAICIKHGKSFHPDPNVSLSKHVAAQRLEATDVMIANLLLDFEEKSTAMEQILS